MKVNSNIQGMIAQAILASNEEKLSKSTERMSSGYKLNLAKDNPAGMAISNRMRAQLQSLDRANKNAKNAVNAVQTAEGALSEIEEMLQRMNELSIQAANGTMSSSDRKACQEEVDQLMTEITRISKNTTYNSQGLLDGTQDFRGYSFTDGSTTYNSGINKLSLRNYNELFDTGKYSVSVDGTGEVTKLEKDGQGVEISSQDITAFLEKDGKIIAADAKDTADLIADGAVVTGYATTVHTADGGEITFEVKDPAGATDIGIDVAGIGGMKVQTGAEEGQEIQVIIPEVSLRTLNFVDLDGNRTVDLTTEKSSDRAIEAISKAISYVSAARSKIGAYQNRIEKTISNLDVTTENLTQSYSTLKDIDMAEEMVEYTTRQVLVQAGTTMLAQANEQPQQALQLLQ